MTPEGWGAIIVAVIGALGLRELLAGRVSRRDRHADDQAADRRQLSTVEGQANVEVLRVLLEEMKSRVGTYEQSIRDLRDAHQQDITELKLENADLKREVINLRNALEDYKLGQRVPRGQVLVPLVHVQMIREQPGKPLPMPWYPGEPGLETDDPGYLDVRMRPLPPGPSGRSNAHPGE